MFQNCYHLCTTALRDAVLCQDRQDYLFLWNSIAICGTIKGLRFFCLCLMSNHFHILLMATDKEIESFFARLKSRMGRYLKKKYGTTPTSGMEYKLFTVSDRKAFCEETAYILRNPFKARIDSPLTWPWNSASAYFLQAERIGKPVSKMSVRDRLATLTTRLSLPGELRVSPDGMVLPESFVDSKFTENMFFGSTIQFFDLIKKWNLEDIVDGAHGEAVVEAYSDEEVIKGIKDICTDDFGGLSPERMSGKMLARLIKRVHNRFGSPRAQLLRLLPVDDYLLERLL